MHRIPTDDTFYFSGTNIPSSEFSLPQNVADKIGKLIMDKFTEVIVGQATQHSRRKVLAGVVMTTDGEFSVLSTWLGGLNFLFLKGKRCALMLRNFENLFNMPNQTSTRLEVFVIS
jgi:kynureninase